MNIIPFDYCSNMYINYYYGSLINCTSDWKGINVVCSYSKFYFILKGECIIEIEGTKYYGKKGRLFLIPAGVKHSFYHYNDNLIKKYWFHFNIESGGNNFFESLKFPFYVDITKYKEIIHIFKDILKYSSQINIQYILYLKARIIELIALYLSLVDVSEYNYNSSNDIDISQVIIYIKNNLTSRISINELADIVHLHPNYFIRLFKGKMGTSPAKYINILRMEKSKALLENTKLTINEIMQAVGYSDLSHFSKCFKKYSGYSPKQFRNLYHL